MSDHQPSTLERALLRLSAALDKLDAVSLRQAESTRLGTSLEAELNLMREDRHKLASLIDAERASRLAAEDSLTKLAPQIDQAMLLIRQTLDEEGEAAWDN